MTVDVITEIVINRPIDVVSNYAADPVERTRVVREHRFGRVEYRRRS